MNPFQIWEEFHKLPNASATQRLYLACKEFQEKAGIHILHNNDLYRLVKIHPTPRETLEYREPNSAAMLDALCGLCRWFLTEISEAFIDHITRKGLSGQAGIEAFIEYSQSFTALAFEHNWKWAIDYLKLGSVDDLLWTNISIKVKDQKVKELSLLWLQKKLDVPSTERMEISQQEEVSPPLIAKRKALLAEYKQITGNPSNRRIYTAKNSYIHKPQFHQWLKGTLPSTSQTCINFERFLKEKKLPIPKTK